MMNEAAFCGDDWREVDRALRGIAKRRAALDLEEARWLREACQVLANERGRFVDDNELVAGMCAAVLGEDANRAKHQIVIRRCDACEDATQEGAGQEIPIDGAAAARAECDADRLEDDGEI